MYKVFVHKKIEQPQNTLSHENKKLLKKEERIPKAIFEFNNVHLNYLFLLKTSGRYPKYRLFDFCQLNQLEIEDSNVIQTAFPEKITCLNFSGLNY